MRPRSRKSCNGIRRWPWPAAFNRHRTAAPGRSLTNRSTDAEQIGTQAAFLLADHIQDPGAPAAEQKNLALYFSPLPVQCLVVLRSHKDRSPVGSVKFSSAACAVGVGPCASSTMLQWVVVNATPPSRVSAIGPIRRGELESVQLSEA